MSNLPPISMIDAFSHQIEDSENFIWGLYLIKQKALLLTKSSAINHEEKQIEDDQEGYFITHMNTLLGQNSAPSEEDGSLA